VVEDGLFSHYDFMPTLLDYFEIEAPEYGDCQKLPGRSFVPLLRGEKPNGHDQVCVFDEYGPTRMIRSAFWKYVHRYPYGPHELYDLENDPGETRNLIDEPEHQALTTRLQGDLESWFARYADPERDGTREAVTGRGQIDVVGPAAKGRKRFEDDVVYEADIISSKGSRRPRRSPDL
jgi:arylsulfatase A-like enzyme